MKACEQAPSLSVYDHGLAVANRYRDLYNILASYAVPGSYEWHIPDESFLALRKLQKLALSPKEIRIYHVFHDCSKPSVLEVDEAGRRHFPNHAEASAKLFTLAAPDDELTPRLISKDMLCHVTKPADAKTLLQDQDFPTLILTAWAELHANASALFGGFDADSFKIKRKQLIKLTKLSIRENVQLL
jgi:hypothetical protein